MSDVPLKTVGDYLTLQRGNTYSGKLVGEPGIPLLGLGSIAPGGGFRPDKFKTYGGESPEKITVNSGDLFVALKGATKDGSMVGSVARLPKSIPKGRLTQDTVRLDFKEEDPEFSKYLYWLLQTPECRSYYGGRITGSASAALGRDDFLSFPVPALSVGRKQLVDFFEEAETKIELNRRMNLTLRAMAQAIFKSWFVDFEPVNAKAAAKAAGANPEAIERAAMTAIAGKTEAELDQLPGPQQQSLAQTAALFPDTFQDSELGKIPGGWSLDPASDHLDAVRGFSYKGAGLADAGTPMHNLNSVYESGGYKYEGIKFYTLDYKEKHRAVPGDVIVANTEQGFDHLLIGYGALIPKCYPEGFISHHTYRVRPKEASPLTNYFILHLFLPGRFRALVAGFTNGTTVNMLPPAGLSMPEFVCPTKELIDAFTTTVEPMYDQVESNVHQSRTLAQLRDTLLPKLLSGKLPVPEAQSQTKEALA